MATDMQPGKFSSEKGGFYFSCDTGSSVLVGITGETQRSEQPPTMWTCPVLGLIRFNLDTEKEEDTQKLIDLESGSEILFGAEDGPKFLKVPIDLWIKVFPQEKYLVDAGEWGSGYSSSTFVPITPDEPRMTHVIAVAAAEGSAVIRFHFAFE